MFLEQQISILEWFLEDYVTLKRIFVNQTKRIESKHSTVTDVACQTTACYIIASQPLGVLWQH